MRWGSKYCDTSRSQRNQRIHKLRGGVKKDGALWRETAPHDLIPTDTNVFQYSLGMSHISDTSLEHLDNIIWYVWEVQCVGPCATSELVHTKIASLQIPMPYELLRICDQQLRVLAANFVEGIDHHIPPVINHPGHQGWATTAKTMAKGRSTMC